MSYEVPKLVSANVRLLEKENAKLRYIVRLLCIQRPDMIRAAKDTDEARKSARFVLNRILHIIDTEAAEFSQEG